MIKDITVNSEKMLQAIFDKAHYEAEKAMDYALKKWRVENPENTGGGYHEPMYCGFAWVMIEVNGATKLGRLMKKMGIDRRVGNPGGYRGQSLDIKEVGAEKFVEVMRANNFKAFAYSRGD